MPTLYDRVGKHDAVASVVKKFYDHLMANPKLAAYFKGKDMT